MRTLRSTAVPLRVSRIPGTQEGMEAPTLLTASFMAKRIVSDF